jgi:hypothetical protein
MPAMPLELAEIRDLVAYIRSLKQGNTNAILQVPPAVIQRIVAKRLAERAILSDSDGTGWRTCATLRASRWNESPAPPERQAAARSSVSTSCPSRSL